MANAQPLEIVVGGASVYHAPTGTSFPAIDVAPSAPWELIGTLGDENYGESGVMLRFPRTFNAINVLGSTMPRKHVISEVGFQVEFDVMDMNLEQLALGYGVDPADIATTAGDGTDAGFKVFNLPDDPIPYQQAILVRINASPYMADGKMQFEVFSGNQVGNAEGSFTKTGAFQVRHIWSAVKTADGAVAIRAQHEAAPS